MDSEGMEVRITIPKKLYEAIEKIVNEGLFSSIEDFILHGTRLLAELYGLSSESLIQKIIEKYAIHGAKKPQVSDLTPLEQRILNSFGKTKYMYIDEYYAIILREFITMGETPPKKEEFYKIIEKLVEKGYLEKIEKDGEILLKKKEE